MILWGSGRPRREFLFVEDLADACVFLMKGYSDEVPINVGYGSDVTIRELADVIARVVGFAGALAYDASKPDGPPQKLLDSARINALGWRASTSLEDGIARTYAWYQARHA
jgi:GDP-L-fucose synthase